MKKKKNGEIELLRFVFAVCVLVFHSLYLLPEKILNGGSFCVEFFFVLSGCLMMSSIERTEKKQPVPDCLGLETFAFLKKKLGAIYPELVISLVIALLFKIFTSEMTGYENTMNAVKAIPGELFLLRLTGFGDGGLNGPVWYISAMIIAMAVLYPLLRRYKYGVSHVALPIISCTFVAILIRNTGSLYAPTKWIDFACKGVIRAIADLGFGVVCYYIAKAITGKNINAFGRILLTLVKWGCYTAVVAYVINGGDGLEYVCYLALILAVAISFSGKSIEAVIYNNWFFYALGTFSMPLFLGHYFLSGSNSKYGSLKNVLPDTMTDGDKMTVYILCALIASALIYLLGQLFRKNRTGLSSFFRKIFIKRES